MCGDIDRQIDRQTDRLTDKDDTQQTKNMRIRQLYKIGSYVIE